MKHNHNDIVKLRNEGKTCKQIIQILRLECSEESLWKYTKRCHVKKNVQKNDISAYIIKLDKKTTLLPPTLQNRTRSEFGHATCTLNEIARTHELRQPNLSATLYGKRNVRREIRILERSFNMDIGRIREIVRNERGLGRVA